MRTIAATLAAMILSAPVLAQAQPFCVPGNPLYDSGDYRCFNRPPRPTSARASVNATVEAARYLSGGALTADARDSVEDHFNALERDLGAALPSLVDGHGSLHTPDVRLAVVLLPSGQVGRVRVLTRHGDSLDREIARSLAAAVSSSEGLSVDGSEVEVIVRLHPRLHYNRWRRAPSPRPCYDCELDE